MPLTVDTANVASNSVIGGTTLSLNYVCAAGVNRVLISGGSDSTGGALASGITNNGVAALVVPSGGKTNTQETVDWYYVDNPPIGASIAAAVTYPTATNAIALLVIPLKGADLTRVPLAGTGTQGVPSANIACSTPAATANDIAFAATQNRGTTQVAGGAPQTNVVTLNGINASSSYACSSIAGPSAGNFTWTITSGNWSAIGVTVFGTSGGGGGGSGGLWGGGEGLIGSAASRGIVGGATNGLGLWDGVPGLR